MFCVRSNKYYSLERKRERTSERNQRDPLDRYKLRRLSEKNEKENCSSNSDSTCSLLLHKTSLKISTIYKMASLENINPYIFGENASHCSFAVCDVENGA